MKGARRDRGIVTVSYVFQMSEVIEAPSASEAHGKKKGSQASAVKTEALGR
jgi:hypothetical protein